MDINFDPKEGQAEETKDTQAETQATEEKETEDKEGAGVGALVD